MGYSENDNRRASCYSIASSLASTALEEFGDDNMRPPTRTKEMAIDPLEKMVEIQSQAEFYLRSAIMNERARRWEKVVDVYRALLKLISRPSMPQGFTITDSYVMLIYESYYHLGVALQNLERHKEAIGAYTQAMNAVNIHKNGCLAGCNSNSCFQTPVLAKRSYAHARAGDMKNAFVDIEKAVVLDTRNSDLFCIRALLWNTNKDTEKAVDDLNRALRYNPCHVCALLLRGSIDQPFRMTFNFMEGLRLQNNEKSMKKDHVKAQQISPQAVQFLDVTTIHSKKLIKLWNRFLWSLSVPRNIVHPELMEGFKRDRSKGTTHQMPELTRNKTMPIIQINGTETEVTPSRTSESNFSKKPPRSPVTPFRCGTPTIRRNSVHCKRRHSYGEALRTYSAVLKATNEVGKLIANQPRPQTANTTQILPSRTQSQSPSPVPRPPSNYVKKRPSVTFSRPLLTVPGRQNGTMSAPPNLVHPQHSTRLSPTLPMRRASLAVVPMTKLSYATPSPSVKSQRDVAFVRRRSASEYAHQVHGLRVFEPLNVNDAPRMYYKPWTGDKLPVADIKCRQRVGVFRV
ncbi:uncharacterized protein LOC120338726 [Styela clava]